MVFRISTQTYTFHSIFPIAGIYNDDKDVNDDK